MSWVRGGEKLGEGVRGELLESESRIVVAGNSSSRVERQLETPR